MKIEYTKGCEFTDPMYPESELIPSTPTQKEQAEIDILSEYLPQALSDAEVDALIDEAIAETGATNARDLGKVMGWLAPRTRGRAEGKVVSGKVASALARADLAVHDETGH